MIGGLMLMMAIGAMLIICFEADMGDDLADLARRSGLLAMRPPKGASAAAKPSAAGKTRSAPPPRRKAAHAPGTGVMHESEAREIAEEIAARPAMLATRSRRSLGAMRPALSEEEERETAAALDAARARFGGRR